MNPLRREVVVQGVPVLHVGQQWCGQMVHCDCWGPWQAGRVHQKVAGNLLAQGTEGRQLLDQGGLKKEYSHFRNYAPPLDEKGGIITEKVFPVFSERVFRACFGLVI